MAALGTAAALSSTSTDATAGQSPYRSSAFLSAIGLVIGIVVHGILDYLPHSYPIPSRLDVALSLILVVLTIAMAKPKTRSIVLACYLGCILPDVIDLAPAILNRTFGLGLPTPKMFPWHWPKYSGSIYDGSKKLESALLHFAVLALSIGLIVRNRRTLLA